MHEPPVGNVERGWQINGFVQSLPINCKIDARQESIGRHFLDFVPQIQAQRCQRSELNLVGSLLGLKSLRHRQKSMLLVVSSGWSVPGKRKFSSTRIIMKHPVGEAEVRGLA